MKERERERESARDLFMFCVQVFSLVTHAISSFCPGAYLEQMPLMRCPDHTSIVFQTSRKPTKGKQQQQQQHQQQQTTTTYDITKDK